MKKQIIDQIDFFLGGMLSRLSEDPSYLERLDAEFRSGIKPFGLSAIWQEGALHFHFAGQKQAQSPDGFRRYLLEQAPLYDSLTVTYWERGKCIVLEADGKGVRTKTTNQELPKATTSEAGHSGTSTLLDRDYFIKPGRADALLQSIGIQGKNGKIKNDRIRKYNQIDHFVELLDPLLRSLCEKHDPVRVIDCACGKSYLSFVLNYYMKEVLGRRCLFTGLDYNGGVIESSKKMAEELHYGNMQFVQTDIMDYVPQQSYQLLLTLHACDTATDKALAFAIRHKIPSVVCVPCCHRELSRQYQVEGWEDILRYGVLKARIADSLTDGLRALYLEAMGYDVSVAEYVSPLDTPKNIVLRAHKKRGIQREKLAKYHALCRSIGAELTLAKDCARMEAQEICQG